MKNEVEIAGEVIMSPAQLTREKQPSEVVLTPMQKALKAGLTALKLVDSWSGTMAQLNCNVQLSEVVNSQKIPTLADVGRVFGNSVSVKIITSHLNSVLHYSDVTLTDAQLAETALSILQGYWFLNLAELCIFFSQLKCGVRGQIIWGTKINNQALMVELAEFCRERHTVIGRIETDKQKQAVERGSSRIESHATSIVSGIEKVREIALKAKESIEDFLELFPEIPSGHSTEVWWKAWKGEKEALRVIYGDDMPPSNIAVKDIGEYLCSYNIQKQK